MGHIDLAAPVSHIWFVQGCAEPIGYLLDIAPRELEKVLYFAASIVTAVDDEKRAKDLNGLEDKVKAESERIDVDRDEALAGLEDRCRAGATTSPRARSGTSTRTTSSGSTACRTGPRSRRLPTLEDTRGLVSGLFVEVAGKITTEDSKKIRESSFRNAAIREDRQLSPKELEVVAGAAVEIREALAPLYKELESSKGSKKGAVTKHINRLLDGLLGGEELKEEDQELLGNVDAKQVEKARDLGNGLLREVLEQADTEADANVIRELTNDLCLRTDGRIQKEDLDAIIQWSLKVREMYLDMEARRRDAHEAAEESVRRLEQTWELFRELEPKQIVNDEQLFRELKDRFGSRTASVSTSGAGWARNRSATCSRSSTSSQRPTPSAR